MEILENFLSISFRWNLCCKVKFFVFDIFSKSCPKIHKNHRETPMSVFFIKVIMVYNLHLY